MKTICKIAVLFVLMLIIIGLMFCVKNMGKDRGGSYEFGVDIAFIERDAGRKLEESEYVKRILEYSSAYSFNPITFYYTMIAAKEYYNRYPDSISANVWHIFYQDMFHSYIDEFIMNMMPY